MLLDVLVNIEERESAATTTAAATAATTTTGRTSPRKRSASDLNDELDQQQPDESASDDAGGDEFVDALRLESVEDHRSALLDVLTKEGAKYSKSSKGKKKDNPLKCSSDQQAKSILSFSVTATVDRVKQYSPHLFEAILKICGPNPSHHKEAPSYKKPRRDVKFRERGAMFVLAHAMFIRSQSVNVIQIMVGLIYLYEGATTMMFQIANAAGYCVSKKMLIELLGALKMELVNERKKFVREHSVSVWLDNVNWTRFTTNGAAIQHNLLYGYVVRNKEVNDNLDNTKPIKKKSEVTDEDYVEFFLAPDDCKAMLEWEIGYVAESIAKTFHEQFGHLLSDVVAKNKEDYRSCQHDVNFPAHLKKVESTRPQEDRRSELVMLGLLNKDENKKLECVEACREYQHQMGRTEDDHDTILFNGDQLTNTRVTTSKRLARNNNATPDPKNELLTLEAAFNGDFHGVLNTIKGIRNVGWGKKSEIGSFSFVQNLWQRNNVAEKKSPVYFALDRFLLDYLHAVIDSQARKCVEDGDVAKSGSTWTINELFLIADKFLDFLYVEHPKEFLKPLETAKDVIRDNCVMILRTQYLKFGIRNSNGFMVVRAYKFFFPRYLGMGMTNYCREVVILLNRLYFDLSEFTSYILLHNRSISEKGNEGHDVAGDMCMEHWNRALKALATMKSSGSLNYERLERLSHVVHVLKTARETLAKELKIPVNSSKHTDESTLEDVLKFSRALTTNEAFRSDAAHFPVAPWKKGKKGPKNICTEGYDKLRSRRYISSVHRSMVPVYFKDDNDDDHPVVAVDAANDDEDADEDNNVDYRLAAMEGTGLGAVQNEDGDVVGHNYF